MSVYTPVVPELSVAYRIEHAPIYYLADFTWLAQWFQGNQWIGPAFSGIDIETEAALSPHDGEVATVQIELNGACYVVHWNKQYTLATVPGVEWFRYYLEHPQVKKVIHNATFELMFFIHTFGLGLRPRPVHDTMAGDYILAEGIGYDDEMGTKADLGLDDLVERRYGIVMDKDKELRTGFRRRGVMRVTPPKLKGSSICMTCGTAPTEVLIGSKDPHQACNKCAEDPKFKRLKKREAVKSADFLPVEEMQADLTERQLRYAAFDALWCAQLAQDQLADMLAKGSPDAENFLRLLDLDSLTAEVIARMQLHGVPVNRGDLECLDAEWQYDIMLLTEDIQDLCSKDTVIAALRAQTTTGEDGVLYYRFHPDISDADLLTAAGFDPKKMPELPNPNSDVQMPPILNALGYPVPSYEAGELKRFKGDPLIDKILDYKSLKKLQGTYTKGFLEKIHPKTLRLHPQFPQFNTSTGRMASNKPNFQNLPSKSKRGLQVRAAVQALPGYTFIICDYSQIELRLIAEMFNDPRMIEAFQQGKDLHSLMASAMTGVPYEEIIADKEKYAVPRASAKPANFGLGYGAGVKQLINIAWTQYGIHWTYEEAANIRNTWLNLWTGVATYHNNQKLFIKNGVGAIRVASQMGRVRRMPRKWTNAKGEHKTAYAGSLNHPIQSTGAEIVKLAMCRLMDELPEGCHILLQVHDELVTMVPIAIAEQCAAQVKRTMEDVEQPFLRLIPAQADVKISPFWTK